MTYARLFAPLAVTVLAIVAAGCRSEEQNRPLGFTPHVYQGEKLPPLTEQQNRELRERGNLMR
ncbi:MAG: hypothetical protein F9K29_03855 [Hyphomicrobiaceae bacterium]|nr:MAG: hypothetical protein F9K29_03855 [Hyphomicrobiaceae bacterium]